MSRNRTGTAALISCCAAIFWPGAFIFGFPGVMGQHWQNTLEVGQGAIGQCLFFVLAGVGFFMYLTGRWQEKIGTSWITALGVILCGMSAIIVGHARDIKIVYLWAFLVGISSAFIYIPTLTVVQRWYPQRRGLVAGLVSMVFGLSAAVMSPIFGQMLIHLGYVTTTLITGLLALFIGLTVSPFVRLPVVPASQTPGQKPGAPSSLPSLSVSQSLRTRTFWLLWFTWAMAGAAGIAMVTLSTTFGVARGLAIQNAVIILTAFNLTNGLGRLVSGYISDMFGRNRTICLTFLAAGLAYLLLPYLEGLAVWAILAAAVGFAFGTLFAVSAPLVGDCFGLKHFGAIFGLVFTAYGFIAGPLGPWLSGYILEATQGNFHLTFTYLGIFFFASAVLIWFARPPKTAEP
jgi:OFA family oxalate/formate antiporter-like MFS transporter